MTRSPTGGATSQPTHQPGAPADARHPSYAALHDDARSLLSGWTPPDAQQEAVRASFLAHLDAHPDAMAKAGPPAHFTASCLVISPDGARVLLTLHRKAHAWFQFGGHFEPGDRSVYVAATREAREESGLGSLMPLPALVHLDRHTLVGSFGRCREHLDFRYAAVADPGDAHQVSEESLDVRWWPVDGLPAASGEELSPLAAAARRLID